MQRGQHRTGGGQGTLGRLSCRPCRFFEHPDERIHAGIVLLNLLEMRVHLALKRGIGLGIPGTVDPQRGTVRHAVNVGIGLDELELGARLVAELGCDVHVENDVRAAALGADWYLSNQRNPVTDLAYLSIGTGIAAGYVERGQLRRGITFVAGEDWHERC